MKHKYEVCQIFVDFFRLVKNQFDKSIKRLRLDNGTEFVNLEFSKFLKDNGVVHELTCVNTPQQTGIAERKNRHLLEVARALLFQMSVPNRSYPNCHLSHQQVTHSCFKRLPSRVFGCVAFVHSYNPHLGKLDSRAVKCVFVSMNVTFHETQSFFIGPPLQGESYLEVESVTKSLPFPTQYVIESLPFLTQDVQVQEVTKPTLVPNQVQLSESEVSIHENPIEDVTNDMPIALRKGKRSCVKYPISQFVCVLTISL
ncbi:hypothetical protein CR513_31458, partial [Mucuna pruriens]